jgi:hypothetical protein
MHPDLGVLHAPSEATYAAASSPIRRSARFGIASSTNRCLRPVTTTHAALLSSSGSAATPEPRPGQVVNAGQRTLPVLAGAFVAFLAVHTVGQYRDRLTFVLSLSGGFGGQASALLLHALVACEFWVGPDAGLWFCFPGLDGHLLPVFVLHAVTSDRDRGVAVAASGHGYIQPLQALAAGDERQPPGDGTAHAVMPRHRIRQVGVLEF